MTIQWKCFQDEKPEMKKELLVRFVSENQGFYHHKISAFDRPFNREKNKYSENYYEYFCSRDRAWQPIEDQARVFWEYLDK